MEFLIYEQVTEILIENKIKSFLYDEYSSL